MNQTRQVGIILFQLVTGSLGVVLVNQEDICNYV